MPSLPFRVVLSSALAVLLLGVAHTASADADMDHPVLPIDGPPPENKLPTVTVVGHPIPDPPTEGGPPSYGGIAGPGGDLGGGRGAPFERNRGETELVHDASTGDPPCPGDEDATGSNPQEANPIVVSTGNKIETEVDFTSAGEMPLTLIRTYDSAWKYIGIFGKYWVSNLDYSITIATDESTIYAQRPDGRRIKFIRDPSNSNRWNEDRAAPIAYILRSGSNYIYSTEDNYTESYDGEGRIVTRTNVNGITWLFSYTNRFLTSVSRSSGRLDGSQNRMIVLSWDYDHGTLNAVIAPNLSTYSYSYTADAFGPGLSRLASVTTPGSLFDPAVTTTYLYENASLPGALTGKSFNGTRYSTFAYDTSARATDSKHAGPTANTYVDAYHFVYSGTPTDPPSGGPGDPPPPGVPCNPTTHQCPHPQFEPAASSTVQDLDDATEATAAEDALVSMIPAVTNTVIETNPLNFQTTYTFVDGRLTGTSSPASAHCSARSSSRTYDTNGYDNQITDFNGNVTDYNYAANGQLSQKVEAFGSPVARTTSYTWDTVRNRPLTKTVSGLNQTTYVYSPQNRVASVTIKNLAPYGTANQTRTWNYTYTTWLNGASGTLKTVVADGPLSGDTVTSSYSEDGDLLTVVSPTGTTTYSGYDAWGRPSHVVGENGEAVDYAYYGDGKLKSITTYPDGATAATTTYIYANGLLSSVTTPDGVTTGFTYDNARRLVSTSKPVIGGAAIRTLTYDTSSNVTQIDDNLGTTLKRRASFQYDELDRVRTRSGMNSQIYTYTYDNNGNLKTATDSYSKTTTYYYDGLNRLSSWTGPLSTSASFTYNAADLLKTAADSNGVMTTYNRDGFGQLWQESSPDRGTTNYAWLSNGTLDTMTRGNLVQTAYQFDPMGRLTNVTAGGQSETFTYDTCTNGIGRLCTATAPSTTLNYTYEPDGRVRLRQDKITVAGVLTTNTTSYTYDTVGRLLKLTYPNGEFATYSYTTGQPSSLTMTIAGVAKTVVSAVSFEPFGRLSGYTHTNGLVRDNTFDLDGRYSGITSKNGTTALQSLGFVYDHDDRVTTISNFMPTYSKTYGYDDLSHLTSATNAALPLNLGYSYDGNGNRLTMDPYSSVYTYNSGTNRIASVSNVFIAPDGTIGFVSSKPADPDSYNSTFDYDGAGNIKDWAFTSGGLTATYVYDGFNRMTSVSNTYSGSVIYGKYGYNAFGERTNKQDLVNGNNYSFIYGEGHQLIADKEDTVWTNYLWFAGELVAMTRAGAPYDIDSDHLGRPELVTNGSKSVVWQANNDPFGGGDITPVNAIDFNIGFPGQYYDKETHYWYNVNRYYVDALGRYLQPDPIGLVGGMNPYSYVGDNPANRVDPMGLNPVEGAILGAEWGSAFGPIGTFAGALVGLAGGYYGGEIISSWVDGLMDSSAKPSREQKPDSCPTGTKPIDQSGLSKDDIHGIKEGINAGAKDWVGIDPNGHVWINEGGEASDQGPFTDYLP